MSPLRAALLVLLGLALVTPARATWSIVVLNRLTGEVAVATSTCLSNSDISTAVPLIRVGYGAAASQSFVIFSGINKQRIFANMPRGATPQQMLDYIGGLDTGFQQRQFGIVAFSGAPASHTGTSNGFAALGVVGEVGELSYAIQGNVLAGGPVIYEAEAALLTTQGDLGQKIMAAMEVARDFGGDGRCSCSSSGPATCGAPPVNGFTYASYNAFFAIARLGDVDGVCTATQGCANGDYYFRFNYVGTSNTAEPIGVLRGAFDSWRAGLAGRPDHILSRVDASLPVIQADGITRSTVVVELVDVDGQPLGVGGQTVTVTPAGDAVATVGPITDLGNGTHTFELTATAAAGEGSFTIVVDDGVRPVRLHPPLAVRSTAPAELHLGVDAYSDGDGTAVPMVVDRGVPDAGRLYRVLGSYSGTSPGTTVGGAPVALNRDRFFDFTLGWPGGDPFFDSSGALDASGRAEPLLALAPGSLAPFVGSTLSFVALIGGTDTTNNAGVLIGP